MALDVLAQGRLVKTPEQRTGASGRPFALAQLSVAMEEGDTCAVAGRAKVGTWTNREGETRPSLSITVDQVLTVYAIRKMRIASQGDDSGPDDSTPTPARDRAATASQTSRRPVLAGAGIAGMADDVPF